MLQLQVREKQKTILVIESELREREKRESGLKREEVEGEKEHLTQRV
jgi:hypothetical protein